MRIIGLEEHFVTSDVVKAWQALDPKFQDPALKPSSEGEGGRRLLDLDGERFASMDDAGVDVQVVSLTAPGVQNLDPDPAVGLQTASNDTLATAVAAHPERLQGFATLATPDPSAAARELERAVTRLRMNGAMLHGRTRDKNLDHADFWPIFEAAEALRAPLYLHPQSPPPAVRAAYYDGFGAMVDSLFSRPGIGWHYETGVQLLRMILAGVFDRFPNLQIIAGHWGEVVLFYLDRIDMLGPVAKLPRLPSDYFRDHVMVTASGLFSPRYMRWAIELIGIDRIMFATDYPFASKPTGTARRFLEAADLSDGDRTKVASGNWERLVAGIRR